MTNEEQMYVHYLKCYAVARLSTGVSGVRFEEDEPREAAACALGIRDGVMQADPKTKSQVEDAVEALLV